MPKRTEEDREVVQLEVGDSVNEMILIAAAMLDPTARARVTKLARPEQFLEESNQHVWAALQEIERRKLDYSHAVLAQLVGNRVKAGYAAALLAQFPDVPDAANLDHHVATLKWDHKRAIAMRGPLSELLTAFRDPAHPPERVAAIARHLAEALAGSGESWLEDPKFLVAKQMDEIQRGMDGQATFPFGIHDLDFYEAGARNGRGEDISGRARLIPGAKPGHITVLTAFTGGGKSTFAAWMALGLFHLGRRVMYGAWEPGTGMTIELLATMDLGWSRTDVAERRLSPEDKVTIEEKMHELLKGIVMMSNPFQKVSSGQKPSNERNLDLVQQHVVDSGCNVWFADLWDRCIDEDRPDQMKRALWRTASICEETQTHCVPLVQQKIKGEDLRADMQPSVGNIFGTSEWAYVASCILAPHRKALFKNVPNDKLDVLFLKSRWGGGAPSCIQFDYDPEFGSVHRGITVPFEHAVNDSELGDFVAPSNVGGKRRRSKR
jgi:replicative DNA helicase